MCDKIQLFRKIPRITLRQKKMRQEIVQSNIDNSGLYKLVHRHIKHRKKIFVNNMLYCYGSGSLENLQWMMYVHCTLCHKHCIIQYVRCVTYIYNVLEEHNLSSVQARIFFFSSSFFRPISETNFSCFSFLISVKFSIFQHPCFFLQTHIFNSIVYICI